MDQSMSDAGREGCQGTDLVITSQLQDPRAPMEEKPPDFPLPSLLYRVAPSTSTSWRWCTCCPSSPLTLCWV